jgi:exonuclease III
LRNLDPAKTLLIQPVRKPLPFRATGWSEIHKGKPGGNIWVSSDPSWILTAMGKSTKDIIVVDDFQYVLANMYMQSRQEKGYEKFTRIGGAGYDIVNLSSQLAPNKRVYILAHTYTGEDGKTRIKTLGKMLDDKVVIEGMFTTVLRTFVESGKYCFSTQNNGFDTVKSPMGMFSETLIDNDLAAIDKIICEYYNIGEAEIDETELIGQTAAE